MVVLKKILVVVVVVVVMVPPHGLVTAFSRDQASKVGGVDFECEYDIGDNYNAAASW
mgnify:CR=1 FL=1